MPAVFVVAKQDWLSIWRLNVNAPVTAVDGNRELLRERQIDAPGSARREIRIARVKACTRRSLQRRASAIRACWSSVSDDVLPDSVIDMA